MLTDKDKNNITGVNVGNITAEGYYFELYERFTDNNWNSTLKI
jgi:hypothetical protein